MGFRPTALVAAAGFLFSLGCEGSFGDWDAEAILSDPTWESARCGLAVNATLAALCGEDAEGQRVVTVFRRQSSGRWSQIQQIRPRPGATEPRFGEALAIDAERLAIGAVRAGSTMVQLPEGTRMGYVDVYRYGLDAGALRFVYERTLESFPTWSEVAGPEFGATLALDGETLIVGARYSSSSIGRAFVFDLGTGEETDVLSEYGGLTDEHYATAVDTSSGRLAISKPQTCSSDAGSVCSGEVYVYHRGSNGEWVSERVLSPEYPSDPSVFYRDGFGAAVALGSNWLAVADNQPDEGEPSVYVYRRAVGTEAWTFDSSFEAVGVGRYGLMGRGSALAVSDRGGTREDTGSTVSRVRVLRIRDSVEVEAQIIMPSLDYAGRVDVFGSNLVVSNLVTPPNVLAFRRRP